MDLESPFIYHQIIITKINYWSDLNIFIFRGKTLIYYTECQNKWITNTIQEKVIKYKIFSGSATLL